MLQQEQTCLLAGVAAVEGCGPDAAQDDVQHSEDCTHAGDRS